jgi:hypothetical protein
MSQIGQLSQHLFNNVAELITKLKPNNTKTESTLNTGSFQHKTNNSSPSNQEHNTTNGDLERSRRPWHKHRVGVRLNNNILAVQQADENNRVSYDWGDEEPDKLGSRRNPINAIKIKNNDTIYKLCEQEQKKQEQVNVNIDSIL